MATAAKEMENENQNKKKKRNFGTILQNIVLGTVIILMLLSTLLLIFLESEEFRKPIVDKIVKLVNKSLNATVSIEDIDFTSEYGIEIKNAVLSIDSDTIAVSRSCLVDIDIASLFDNKIKLNNLVLESAGFNLRKDRNGITNVKKIVDSNREKKKRNSKLIIDCADLKLRHCFFTLYDSTKTAKADSLFDPARMNFRIKEFNASAFIDLAKKEMEYEIFRLKAKEIKSELDVQNITGKAFLSTEKLDVRDLNVETDRSEFEINTVIEASVLEPDSSKTFLNSPYKVDINARKLDFADVKLFAPIPFDIIGENEIILSANGYLSDTVFADISYRNEGTELDLKNGYIAGILDTAHLCYGGDIKLHTKQNELSETFPGVPFDKLPQLNEFTLSCDKVFGNLDSAGFNMNLSSAHASVRGRVGYKFKGVPGYSADIDIIRADANKLLRKSNISDSLSGSIRIKGREIKPEKISGEFRIALTGGNIDKYGINNADIDISAESGKFNIDTFALSLSGKPKKEAMTVDFSGTLDFQNPSDPEYEIDIFSRNLDPAFIAANKALPEILSFDLKVRGQGIDPDSLNTDIFADFKEISFYDKSLMPFELRFALRDTAGSRYARLRSEYADADLQGDFSFTRLQRFFSEIAKAASDFSGRYLLPQTPDSEKTEIEEKSGNPTLPELDCKFDMKIKDISAFSTFWEGSNIRFITDMSMNIKSDSTSSEITLDKMNIERFYYGRKQTEIAFDNYDISLKAKGYTENEQFRTDDFAFDIDAPTPLTIREKEVLIQDIHADMAEEKINFVISGEFDEFIGGLFSGSLSVREDKILLTGDSLSVDVDSSYRWHNRQSILIQYRHQDLNIESFELLGPGQGEISLSGGIRDTIMRNIKIQLKSIDLDKIGALVPALQKKPLNTIEAGKVNLLFAGNGSFSDPWAKLELWTESMSIGGNPAGKLEAACSLVDKNISGNARLIQDAEHSVDIAVKRFPTDIFMNKEPENTDIDIKLKISKFNIAPYGALVDPLGNLEGDIEADVSLTGGFPGNLSYAGNFRIPSAAFTLKATNVDYFCKADINFDNEDIEIYELLLQNTEFRRPGGISISGDFKLDDNFLPEDIDLDIRADRFRVISEKTKAVLPVIYGDLFISTPDKIYFSGSLGSPVIEGDLALDNSNLNMELIRNGKKVESRLKYDVVDDGETIGIKFFDEYRRQTELRRDSLANLDTAQTRKAIMPESDFFRQAEIDIEFFIRGKSSLSTNLGAVGEMYAEIKQADNPNPVDYSKSKGESLGQVFGKITLSDKSTLKTFKLLNLSGYVDFPNHSPIEPSLNITAVYKGRLTDGGARKEYEVIIELTGPPDNLQSKIYYTLQNQSPIGDAAQIQQDALMLLLTGQLPGVDTDSRDGQSANQILQSGTGALLSAFASKSLNGVLQSNYISSAGLDFSGESFEQATIKLSGQLPGNITWTFGGDITDINGSREISVELPVYTLIENESMRNVFLQASWNENSQNTNMDNDETDWEVKLKFNKSW